MDNLSYRTNRSQRSNSEPEPAPVAAPAPVSRTKHSRDARTKHPIAKYLIGLVLVLLVALGLWYFMTRTGVSSAIETGKYQAVFFTNGQVYFGKLAPLNDEYMKLTNVYYLQTKSDADDKETSPQSASKQDSSDVELIKLGGEIHGPEDAMIVSKDQILFFENLKANGNVSQTITNYQNQKSN